MLGAISTLVTLAWVGFFVLVATSTDTFDDYPYDCRYDRIELTAAVADFETLEGRPPESQRELLAGDYLFERIPTYDVAIVDGRAQITPVPGEGCQ